MKESEFQKKSTQNPVIFTASRKSDGLQRTHWYKYQSNILLCYFILITLNHTKSSPFLSPVPTHGCVCRHSNRELGKPEILGPTSCLKAVFFLFEDTQKQVLSRFVASTTRHWLLCDSNPKSLMPLKCYILKNKFKQHYCSYWGGKSQTFYLANGDGFSPPVFFWREMTLKGWFERSWQKGKVIGWTESKHLEELHFILVVISKLWWAQFLLYRNKTLGNLLY